MGMELILLDRIIPRCLGGSGWCEFWMCVCVCARVQFM